jgi:hypothetical protein
VVFSEESLVVDVGAGVVSFERAGEESIVLGKGRVNTNSLAPGELNFLHTLRISSGSVDFGTVPVSIEASVGNTLYINSDNPSKTAPSTAGIYLTGGLNGSALSYEPAPRVWKLEPAASSSVRTISLPPY